MSPPTNSDTQALAEQLSSSDAEQRAAAAERLAQAGPSAAAAATLLVRACGDGDERVREWVVAALEDLGPPPPETIAPLITLANNPDPLTAYWATTLLGRCGERAAPAVMVLAACVESPADPAVRQRAAWALGQIGPAAAGAREVLTRAAAQEDPRLARLATEALAAIGS